MEKEWVLDIRDQCQRTNVAVFFKHFYFKQGGGAIKKKTVRELAGRTWDEMPELAVVS